MRDFTLNLYKELLSEFLGAGYSFFTFEDWCLGKAEGKYIILRHDVDEMAKNALYMALLENQLGIRATYNFRIVRQSDDPVIIKKIADWGHEIGYHYEDLATAEGDYEKAIVSFRRNLAHFRTFYPVKTVSMHGSSTSVYDNRDLWKKYDFRLEGLIGEPYLSINFNEIYYISDTGYCWDGFRSAIRDVVQMSFENRYHHTRDIVLALRADRFPEKAMVSAHTLWTNNVFLWACIFIREQIRNKVKRMSGNHRMIRNIYKKLVDLYWKIK